MVNVVFCKCNCRSAELLASLRVLEESGAGSSALRERARELGCYGCERRKKGVLFTAEEQTPSVVTFNHGSAGTLRYDDIIEDTVDRSSHLAETHQCHQSLRKSIGVPDEGL